ncbi:MAG TPA: endolytic transglycosylase MltG [Spirochaetaceae bacterium]|nr:endolytic transglycosylase MltG [Spirochaetaceae bacterium]
MGRTITSSTVKAFVQFIVLSGVILLLVCSILMLIPPFRKDSVEIKIEKGSSLSVVARELREVRIIPSSKVFGLYMYVSGADRTIKPGTYSFAPLLSPVLVAQKLVRGETMAKKVMIPEGRTASQIARILESQNIVSREAFLKEVNNAEFAQKLGIPAASCEGYLFPDTYFFEEESDPQEVIEQMVANFRAVIKRIDERQITAEELHRNVILASIVEREYRVPEDAPIIASVFFNRIEAQMPLQSCATVVYVLTEHLGQPHPSVVYYNDLRVKDPYNTYIHRGLPPGPISNPGEISLRAVLFPSKTDFLYFRLESASSGKHRFSRTLSEHNEVAIIPKGL